MAEQKIVETVNNLQHVDFNLFPVVFVKDKTADYEWEPNNPGPADGDDIISSKQIGAVGFWVKQLAQGSGAGVDTSLKNVPVVNPDTTPVAGKVFATSALATTFILTQTPSISNRWSQLITGSNSENIRIRNFIGLLGLSPDTTILTGDITVTDAFAGSLFQTYIKNCRIESLVPNSASSFIHADECEMAGGTIAALAGLLTFNCIFLGGDYSASSSVSIYGKLVLGGTFPSALICEGVDMSNALISAITLNGIKMIGGSIDNTNITFNAGIYTFKNVDIDIATLTIGNGYSVQFTNCSFKQATAFTVNGSALLQISGYAGAIPTASGAGTISISGFDVNGNMDVDGVYKNDGVQVVSAQGAAVADSTVDLTSVSTQLNLLLARMRAHGLINT